VAETFILVHDLGRKGDRAIIIDESPVRLTSGCAGGLVITSARFVTASASTSIEYRAPFESFAVPFVNIDKTRTFNSDVQDDLWTSIYSRLSDTIRSRHKPSAGYGCWRCHDE